LGAFILVTLLIFGAGIFWIGNGQFRFTSTYRVNAYFQNVAGLTEGASVRVGGLHQGTMRHIVLPPRPDQKVRVEMDLAAPSRQVIKRDSVASIQTEGLVGDQYVEVTFGSPGAPRIRNGDTIGAEPPLQISEMIRKTNSILDSVQDATNNLDSITAKLNGGQGSVGALLNSRAVYRNVDAAAANLQEDTEALKHNFLLRGFFNNRGYDDSEELKRNAIAELPAGSPSKSFSYAAPKLFEKPDSSRLKGEKALDEAGKFLERNPSGLTVVASWADMKGDTDKDRKLTEARAAVVREYLVQHFKLDDTRIKTIGLGKSADARDGGAVAVMVYPSGKPGR
jgi:phospholipid/cholesterol/gamma-HCH transport system substrate-binding protein